MITIKTRLHDGIYASQGGGQTLTHYEYATGPRNLLKAITQLRNHRASMVRSFGDIGCGGSWIEINGQPINEYDLENIQEDGDPELLSYRTHTQKASALITEVESGEYKIDAYDDWGIIDES